MCSILKQLYISTEEKGFSVRSPSFVLHVLFQLCNATALKLPPDINLDKLCSPQRLGGGNGNCLNLQLPLVCITATGSLPGYSRNIQPSLLGLTLPFPSHAIHPCPMPSRTIFPGPDVSRTSLQTLHQIFSHHSMFSISSVKLDFLNFLAYITSVEKWLQIRAFFSVAAINSDNWTFNSASRCYHSRNAWKSTSLCLMRKTSFLDSNAGNSSGSHHPKFPAV